MFLNAEGNSLQNTSDKSYRSRSRLPKSFAAAFPVPYGAIREIFHKMGKAREVILKIYGFILESSIESGFFSAIVISATHTGGVHPYDVQGADPGGTFPQDPGPGALHHAVRGDGLGGIDEVFWSIHHRGCPGHPDIDTRIMDLPLHRTGASPSSTPRERPSTPIPLATAMSTNGMGSSITGTWYIFPWPISRPGKTSRLTTAGTAGLVRLRRGGQVL